MICLLPDYGVSRVDDACGYVLEIFRVLRESCFPIFRANSCCNGDNGHARARVYDRQGHPEEAGIELTDQQFAKM